MSGIYIHIPFCHSRCIYCDFFSTTSLERRRDYVKSICSEIKERHRYLDGEILRTIYFGGGTPSLLDEEDFRDIFNTIEDYFDINEVNEVTLEANPDDINEDFLNMLSKLPFNRISMGVQSFNNDMLKKINRRHSAEQAIKAVHLARKYGINNISIDLIYGLPGETKEMWEEDMKKAIALGVEHISSYHLTYEEGTKLYHLLKKKKIQEVAEEDSVAFFEMLTKTLPQNGYRQYEISNFAKPGFESQHNSSYWSGDKYLGIGASAHSFNGLSREWNVAALKEYIDGINNGKRIFEREELTPDTRYNEIIMTGLRTSKGVSLRFIEENFGREKKDYCLRMAEQYIKLGELTIEEDYLKLTHKGIFVSDGIISELFTE